MRLRNQQVPKKTTYKNVKISKFRIFQENSLRFGGYLYIRKAPTKFGGFLSPPDRTIKVSCKSGNHDCGCPAWWYHSRTPSHIIPHSRPSNISLMHHCHASLPCITAMHHCHASLPCITAMRHCHASLPLPCITATRHCHASLP